MSDTVEMPYQAWMRLKACSEGKPDRSQKIEAILKELAFCTTEGNITFKPGSRTLAELAESIYLEIFESKVN